jgi:hypothetical protein
MEQTDSKKGTQNDDRRRIVKQITYNRVPTENEMGYYKFVVGEPATSCSEITLVKSINVSDFDLTKETVATIYFENGDERRQSNLDSITTGYEEDEKINE